MSTVLLEGKDCMKKGVKKMKEVKDEALVSLFRSAYMVAKRNLPFSTFSDIISLLQDCQVPYSTSLYNDDKACAEIVYCIAKCLMNRTLEKVATSPWFGVMVDESNDIAKHGHLIIYLSYLEDECVPKVGFYGVVRLSDGSTKKVAHLLDSPGASERLTLYKAELLDEGSFDTAFDGCDGVFHTASPVDFAPKDPQVDLYDPAVRGTLNVLNSCAKAKTVKRVVLTSSISAVIFTPLLKPDDVADESFFSDPEYMMESKLYYGISKTLAEKAAWDFAKESGLDLIIINPAMVVGPILQSTMNTTNVEILKLLTGGADGTYGDIVISWVDVRDVALAHILAFETPTASGRYVLAEQVAHYSQIIDILKQFCPTRPMPTKCEERGPILTKVIKTSSKKAESLGVKFTPLSESLKATVDSFMSRGLLT